MLLVARLIAEKVKELFPACISILRELAEVLKLIIFHNASHAFKRNHAIFDTYQAIVLSYPIKLLLKYTSEYFRVNKLRPCEYVISD